MSDVPDEEPKESLGTDGMLVSGTILEAAFVDPAYQWPPAEGQGKNAIELQASLQLLTKEDASVFTTESAKQRMAYPDKPVGRRFMCCGKSDAAVSPEQMRKYQEKKLKAEAARKVHSKKKTQYLKQKERAERSANKYQSIPEGLLIYRLDTSTAALELVSAPHAKTPDTVLQSCTVVDARAAPHKSRRTIAITDAEGTTHLLTACEQRTATAWLEAMQLLEARQQRGGLFGSGNVSCWTSNIGGTYITDSPHLFMRSPNGTRKMTS